MSPDPNWHAAENEHGHNDYHWSNGAGADAVVWKENRRWHLTYSLDVDSPMFEADLGKTRSVDKALDRAELVIENANQTVSQTYEDMRTLVDMANEIEDRTPQEQAAIDRLSESLEQGPPSQTPERDSAAELTDALREEVMAAYEAWENDLQNTELENEYFFKMDKLDGYLAYRGLERGEDIYEEIPLRSYESLEQSVEQSLDQSLDQSIDRGGRKR